MKRHWKIDALLFRGLGLLGAALLAGLLYLHWRNRQEAPAIAPPSISPVPLAAAQDEPSIEPGRARWTRYFVGHAHFDRAACLARTGREVEAPAAVHRWVDAQGVVNYSDRPPEQAGSRDHSVEAARDVQPVTVKIDTVDAQLPPHAISRAMADAVAIGKVFKDTFRLDTRGGLALRATLAGSDAAFRRAAPNARSNAGVYFGHDRRIVVRTQRSPEATLAVLRHEIVHALVHEWIGNLPTALNEGLADYFEQFQAHGMGGSVDPRRYAWQMRQAIPPGPAKPALARLLNLPNKDFHAYDRRAHYTRSLALVSTLMATPERRAALGAVLRQQRAQPCHPVDAVDLLRRSFPAGFAELAAQWRAHQGGEALGVHAY